MGKMKFGPKITTETVEVKEPATPASIPEPAPVPENRPSPKEVLISKSECDAAKVVAMDLEKYKQNALAKFDKHKRRLNQLPELIQSAQKEATEYTNIKISEVEDRIDSLSSEYDQDISRLTVENESLEKQIKTIQSQDKKLKLMIAVIATIAVIGALI